LNKLAQEIVDKIKAGASLESIATERGVEVKTTPSFKRSATPTGLSAAAARVAFTLPKGGVGTAAGADDNTRVVMVVNEITPAPTATKEQTEALRNELATELQRDTLQTFVTALRTRQGVQINENVYKRAVGLDQQTQ
jgi:peptidyl-prolyl cis-trans isomerase D